MQSIRKYPRTRHIRGSRFQHGDDDLEAVPFSELLGKHLVVEEKIDGANAGMSFGPDAELLLQSRGHYLTGGWRERHFNVLKQWAGVHQESSYYVLGQRYVLYGEWMWAKHTAFYDALPHYFLEFDILDAETDLFLSEPARCRLLYEGDVKLPISQVRVIHRGQVNSIDELRALLGRSAFITGNRRQALHEAAMKAGIDPAEAESHTDMSELMEGLYIKAEEGDHIIGRYKFVRESFTSAILDSETHWLNRPIIQNQLSPGSFERMFEV